MGLDGRILHLAWPGQAAVSGRSWRVVQAAAVAEVGQAWGQGQEVALPPKEERDEVFARTCEAAMQRGGDRDAQPANCLSLPGALPMYCPYHCPLSPAPGPAQAK